MLLNRHIPAIRSAARAKSTARRAARSFLSASQASTCSRRPSTCRSSSPCAAVFTPTRWCTSASPINSVCSPARGTTGRSASSAAPIAAISNRHIRTRDNTEMGGMPCALDSTATPAASRPPAIPHKAVAFVSARCTSTKARSACPCSRSVSAGKVPGSSMPPHVLLWPSPACHGVASLLSAAEDRCLPQGMRSGRFLTPRPSVGRSHRDAGRRWRGRRERLPLAGPRWAEVSSCLGRDAGLPLWASVGSFGVATKGS
ncbi:hypothetical protein GA0115252_13525 [Streptomyces sp. DfronAA-171]|nr:hypothetical protein GA0115252_13525 [Streptomyces sp. DfronAA-171]